VKLVVDLMEHRIRGHYLKQKIDNSEVGIVEMSRVVVEQRKDIPALEGPGTAVLCQFCISPFAGGEVRRRCRLAPPPVKEKKLPKIYGHSTMEVICCQQLR